MKQILWLFLFCSICKISAAQRTKYNFNSNWKVKVQDDSVYAARTFQDDYWKRVTLAICLE